MKSSGDPNAPHRVRARRRWRHYSYLGHVSMMERQLQGMIQSDTLTTQARIEAHTMMQHLHNLRQELATIKDPT